jgi:hypothetical protein
MSGYNMGVPLISTDISGRVPTKVSLRKNTATSSNARWAGTAIVDGVETDVKTWEHTVTFRPPRAGTHGVTFGNLGLLVLDKAFSPRANLVKVIMDLWD